MTTGLLSIKTSNGIVIDGLSVVNLSSNVDFHIAGEGDNYGPGFFDYELIIYSYNQRVIFGTIISILLVVAVIGNVATIYVNITRKNRPLFRMCLISLAISDLLIAIFSSTSQLSQILVERNIEWTLGELLCSTIPFFQVVGILANSMILIVIALDRYMAVKKVINGAWQPTKTFCYTCAILIWGLSAGIGSPTMTAYSLVEFPIILTDKNNHSIWIDLSFGHMFCSGNKKNNFIYHLVVFIIIFLPLLMIFAWLNAVIAKEIYNRRHPFEERSRISNKSVRPEMTSSEKRTSETNTATNSGFESKSKTKIAIIAVKSTSTPQTNTNNGTNQRKTRQLRIFCVIIIIIVVFFVLRLPVWVFALIKTSMFTNQSNWSLNSIFGILLILNCAINPLIYTFLSQTIIVTTKINQCTSNLCSKFFRCCMCRRESHFYESNINQSSSTRPNSDEIEQNCGVYIGEAQK